MKTVKTLYHNIGSQFATYQYLDRGDGSKTVRGDPGKDPLRPIRPFKAPYEVLVVALLDLRHPGPYITL